MSDAYQHFIVPKILLLLNFLASIALCFDFGDQIGQAYKSMILKNFTIIAKLLSLLNAAIKSWEKICSQKALRRNMDTAKKNQAGFAELSILSNI